MKTGSKQFFFFQASFWFIIAVLNLLLAFVVGHKDLAIPLQRAVFIFGSGFLLSTVAAFVYDAYTTLHSSKRNWALVLVCCATMALITALIVNPVTWAFTGHHPASLSYKQVFIRYLDLFFYYLIWSLLILQLKGRKIVDLDANNSASQVLDRITVEKNGEVTVLSCEDISHIEAEGDYVALTTSSGTWLKIGTISSFESQLDNQRFLRIHRSRLVNTDLVANVTKSARGRFDFHMQNGAILSSSPGRREAILLVLPSLN